MDYMFTTASKYSSMVQWLHDGVGEFITKFGFLPKLVAMSWKNRYELTNEIEDMAGYIDPEKLPKMKMLSDKSLIMTFRDIEIKGDKLIPNEVIYMFAKSMEEMKEEFGNMANILSKKIEVRHD